MKWLDWWAKTGFNVSCKWPLGSGYSVEKERAANAEKLRVACMAILSEPDLRPSQDGNCTFCNRGLLLVAHAMGCPSFKAGDLANEMIGIMESGTGWVKDTPERATGHALKGGLAVAGMKGNPHGHVAVVFPAQMQMSDSLGRLVPVVANIGRTVGLMRTTQAFVVACGLPNFYLYGEV